MKSKILKLLMLVSLAYTVILPFGGIFAKLFGYLFVILSILLPADLLLKGSAFLNKKQARLIGVLLVVAILNSFGDIFHCDEWEEVIKSGIAFFACLISISIKSGECSESDINFYFIVNRLIAIVYILYTIIPFSFQYIKINRYGGLQFTLSMGNPNATATRVMFCMCLLLIQFAVLKKLRGKILNIALIAGLTYTLQLLACRTALVCCILGAFLMLFKKRVTKRFLNLAWIAPVLFISLQLILEQYSTISLLGKSFVTGREILYTDFINMIVEDPFQFVMGNFIENKLENLHSIVFSMLFNFGLVGVISYYLFWRAESQYITDNSNIFSN